MLLHLVGGKELAMQLLHPTDQGLAQMPQGKEQTEIVGREAPGQCSPRDHLLQPGGDLAQELIRDPDTEAVVDLAKMLNVQHQQADRLSGQALSLLEQGRELHQPGQAVEMMGPFELLLGRAQAGDIPVEGQQSRLSQSGDAEAGDGQLVQAPRHVVQGYLSSGRGQLMQRMAGQWQR